MLNGILRCDLFSQPCQYGRTFEPVETEWLASAPCLLFNSFGLLFPWKLVCLPPSLSQELCVPEYCFVLTSNPDAVALDTMLCTTTCTVHRGTGLLPKYWSSSWVFKGRNIYNKISFSFFLFLCSGYRRNISFRLELAWMDNCVPKCDWVWESSVFVLKIQSKRFISESGEISVCSPVSPTTKVT